ncbi:uncharacterized protein A1O5_10792 [Cladophialophora psammophila CBS 110553]|uniref:Uncharacterized protein n=1 Tax=Cladophialophora psammophila CBS 110553 TaxID=1182543 RepID=W9WND2_9EURO|nr:uncharacterized protein A1O5_10792 [Cladophialophora psammophila CBS 110553]EXJ66176.1 hypothetical protein A1O5_10792 [Cladophialophora psammophila CBS 110553]
MPGTKTAADPEETMSGGRDRSRETPLTDGKSGADPKRSRRVIETAIATGTGTGNVSVNENETEVDGTEMSTATAGESGAEVATGIEILKVMATPLKIFSCAHTTQITDLNAHIDAPDHVHQPGIVVAILYAHAPLFDEVITIGPGLGTGTSPTMKGQEHRNR